MEIESAPFNRPSGPMLLRFQTFISAAQLVAFCKWHLESCWSSNHGSGNLKIVSIAKHDVVALRLFASFAPLFYPIHVPQQRFAVQFVHNMAATYIHICPYSHLRITSPRILIAIMKVKEHEGCTKESVPTRANLT